MFKDNSKCFSLVVCFRTMGLLCCDNRVSLFLLSLALVFCGCGTTEYVPVVETHTEHHWHTDTVKERDSTHTERTTVIREVDSAAMAKYGIQMEKNQRAWLVLQRELEQRLLELEHTFAAKDTVHDSIPVPYPVEKELSWWERQKIAFGEWVFGVMVLLLLLVIIRKRT